MNLRRDAFQAISDPTRRAILLLLAVQPLTAGVIASNFESSRPTISKHIKVLTECELISQNQKGREIYYQANPSKMDDVDQWVKQFKNLWQSRFDSLDKILEKQKTKLS